MEKELTKEKLMSMLESAWVAGWTARFHHDKKLPYPNRSERIKEIIEDKPYEGEILIKSDNTKQG